MKKELISYTNISGKEQRKLTTTKIAYELLLIFKNHIGRNNGITRDKLFKKLFKEDYDDNNLKHYIYWDFVKKAMNLLRKKSNCFIISKQSNNQYKYFVVKTVSDSDIYVKHTDNIVKRINTMQKKCIQAGIESWYKQPWELHYNIKQIK